MSLDPITTPKQFLQNLFVAGTASVFSQALAAPFESPLMSGYEPRSLKDYVQIMKHMLREEDLAFFWRGNLERILWFSLRQIPAFPLNDLFQKAFSSEDLNARTGFWRSFFGNLAAGGAAGGLSLFMVYPLLFSGVIFQTDLRKKPEERQFSGLRDCFKKAYAKVGMRGFYQGFGVSALHSFAFRAVYFGGYETVKKMVFPEGGFVVKFLVALGVTSVAGLVAYPLDVVQIEIISSLTELEGKKQYKGIVDCVKKVASEEGWKGFVKGARLKPIQAIGPSVNLVLYDKLQSWRLGN